MPRVTEVLEYIQEPELVSWMLRTPKAKREAIKVEAFRVGTRVDELVRQDCLEGGYVIPEDDEACLNCMRAWEDFKRVHPEFIGQVAECQTLLEDKEREVTGHPDFILRRSNEWGIVDLKCSSGIRPNYWTQTAEYSEMNRKKWEAEFGAKLMPRFIAVLRLDKKEGTWEYKEIADETFIRYEVEVFNAMLLMYKHGESVREILRNQLENELLGG